jgi:hypothetical protein
MRDYPVIYSQEPDCEIGADEEFFFMGRKFSPRAARLGHVRVP